MTKSEHLTFGDAMAKVGGFLFYWSGLEQQLTASIRKASICLDQDCPTVRGGLAERLERWHGLVSRLPENQGRLHIACAVRSQALALREVRNLVVHGLQAGIAMPPRQAAYIRCATGGYEDPDGETICYTLEELEHFTQGVDACRRGLINLDYFNHCITRLPEPWSNIPPSALVARAVDQAARQVAPQ